jgi:hypothetical protein
VCLCGLLLILVALAARIAARNGPNYAMFLAIASKAIQN